MRGFGPVRLPGLPRGLASRLATLYALTFALLIGLAFVSLYGSVRAVFDYRLDADLAEDVEWLRTALARDGDAGVVDEIRREGESGDTRELFVVLGTADGTLLHATDLAPWPGAETGIDPTLAREARAPRFLTREFDGRESAARTVVAPIGPDRVVYLAESLEERDEVLALMLVTFALVFAVAVPVATFVVWWLSRRAVRGIEAVSRTARAIREGDLERRARVDERIDEVGNLAGAFNAMADRNQKLIDDMRDMTDNMAHDLRSPLTRVRLVAESTLNASGALAVRPAEAAAEIIGECDRLTRMIDVALDVSEAEAGVSRTRHVPVDTSAVAADVIELFEAVAEERAVTLGHDIEPGLAVSGDRTALERLLVNLLDNALKFTPAGGTVRVVVRGVGDELRLDVGDTGIGIGAGDVDRVFDRYFRVDPSRTQDGAGLGLSYVRAAARLHGGDVGVESEPGGGTRFRVRLPLAPRVGETTIGSERAGSDGCHRDR